MALFRLGALRQALYRLIELSDEKEARKCLETLGRDEIDEVIKDLRLSLSLAETVLREETYAGDKNAA